MGRRKTQQEFENEVMEKLGPDYKVLGQYINKDTKIEMLHYSCGNSFLKRPHDVTSKNSGCPYCNGNQKAKYTEQWVIKNTPTPYSYVSGFINMTTKCNFYCEECKTTFEQMPSRLINQHLYGCNCQKTKKKTHENFLQKLGEDCLGEYEVLEEYKNIDTKIRFKHKTCGAIFQLTPWDFIHKVNKKYCPICYYKKSKGEVAIAEFLQKNQIEYQKEFTFPGLEKKRFDFYLPEYNTAIEFDGEQHFIINDFFGGEQEFKNLQQRDMEKNNLCHQMNIPIIRIPYYHYNNLELKDLLLETSAFIVKPTE